MKSEYYLRSKWTYITIPKLQFFEMEEIILMVRMIKLMVMRRLCGGLGPPTKYRLWPLALTV